MGLSSSQARLLNLTARMHQIEYKAAKLEAQKLQMANESARVYEDYLEALDATKIQIKKLDNTGAVTYKDIDSYQEFLDAGYALRYDGNDYTGKKYGFNISGSNVVTPGTPLANSVINMGYPPASEGTVYLSTESQTGIHLTAGIFGYTDIDGNKFSVGGLAVLNSPDVTIDASFSSLAHNVYGANYETEPTGEEFLKILTNLVNSGLVTIIRTKDTTDNPETSVATDTGLQEVQDETLLKKAEAQYEADMKRIDMKDRKYDTDLAALDTERNAIKQEIDTLKSIAKDNVERTFKLFS